MSCDFTQYYIKNKKHAWRSGIYTYNNSEYDIPVQPLEHDYQVRKLWEAVRNIWLIFSLSEIIPENSRILIIDSRLHINTTVRALSEYNRSSILVYSSSQDEFIGLFDIISLADYLLHFWSYVSNPQFQHRLATVLCCFMNEDASDTDEEQIHQSIPNNLEAPDNVSETSTTSDVNCLQNSSSFQSHLINSWKFIKNHKKQLNGFPPWFTVKLFDCEMFCLNKFKMLYEIMLTRQEEILQSEKDGYNKLLKLLVEPPCTFDPPHPGLYTLEFWNRLVNDYDKNLVTLDPSRQTLEGAAYLIKERLPRVILWNKQRSSPLCYLSGHYLLNHLVQHLRGTNFSALNLKIIEHLQIGVPFDEIKTIHPKTTFKEVLELLREFNWNAIPIITSDTKKFLGFFNDTQILSLMNRVLQSYERMCVSTGPLGIKNLNDRLSCSSGLSLYGDNASEHTEPLIDLTESINSVIYRFLGFNVTNSQPIFYFLEPDTSIPSYIQNDPQFHVIEPYPSQFSSISEKDNVSKKDPSGMSPKKLNLKTKRALHHVAYTTSSRYSERSSNAFPDSAHYMFESHGMKPPLNFMKTVSPAIANSDITLECAICHLLQTKERKVVLIDPETKHLKRLIATGDLLDFLLGSSNFSKSNVN